MSKKDIGWVEVADQPLEIPQSNTFNLDLPDGYTFRKFFDQHSHISYPSATLIFSETGIAILCNTTDNTFVTNAVLYKHKLLKYNFMSDKPIIKKVSIKSMTDALKPLGKNTGIRMYTSADSENIYYQIFKDANSIMVNEVNIIYVLPDTSLDSYILPVYNSPIHNPNCVMYSPSIKELYARIKMATSIELSFFEKGMKVVSKNGNTFSYHNNYGELDGDISASLLPMASVTASRTTASVLSYSVMPPGMIERFILAAQTMKIFEQFPAINPRGTVAFYCEVGKPLKICSSIGDYGEMTIYITKNHH